MEEQHSESFRLASVIKLRWHTSVLWLETPCEQPGACDHQKLRLGCCSQGLNSGSIPST